MEGVVTGLHCCCYRWVVGGAQNLEDLHRSQVVGVANHLPFQVEVLEKCLDLMRKLSFHVWVGQVEEVQSSQLKIVFVVVVEALLRHVYSGMSAVGQSVALNGSY